MCMAPMVADLLGSATRKLSLSLLILRQTAGTQKGTSPGCFQVALLGLVPQTQAP
jgi:hypothetical protein